jgi:hypothetical protein
VRWIVDCFRLKMELSAIIAELLPAILLMIVGVGCGRPSLGKIIQLLIGLVTL